jgi:hypothetical protein
MFCFVQDMDELGTFADGSINGCDTSSELNSPPYLPGKYSVLTIVTYLLDRRICHDTLLKM